VSLIRPETEVSSMRSIGAFGSGALNDALIRMRLSLTVGSRWRTEPGSQAVLDGSGVVTDCAKRSAGTAAERAIAPEARKNSRRFAKLMAFLSSKLHFVLLHPVLGRFSPSQSRILCSSRSRDCEWRKAYAWTQR
jgi:hypothetical protein